jgi:3-oxoadipate enol-lactonase
MLPSIYSAQYLKANKVMLEKQATAMKSLPLSYLQGQKILYETFLKEATITDQLHKIVCPTLIVYRENDILKPVKFSRIIAKILKHSEFVILPDCGHVAIFEKQDKLLSLITGFIVKHSIYSE